MKMNLKTKIAALSLPLVIISATAVADQVILDDLIVDGSICVGLDCVNGESFGFDTLRLKENNLRIKFQDTSASASFPTNDWQLTANDSSNGGANKFSIDDIDGGRTPFTIEAAARTNALYVENDGDIGLGTANPVVNLHMVDGNTPTMRLEQDGSSGFTAQTYDVAANEANFFIRDVTNGSALFFRSEPGAPASSIHIDSSGDIGMNTASPTEALHIRRTSGTAKIFVENTDATMTGAVNMLELTANGGPTIALNSTAISRKWEMTGGNQFRIFADDDTDIELSLNRKGNMTLVGSLTTGGGTCGTGCDQVFTADYDLPSIEDHAAQMWENGYLPNVGPTIENEPINVSDKLGRMLNELEKAHIYIEQVNAENQMLKERLDRLEARLQ